MNSIEEKTISIKPYKRKPHYYETDQMAIIHHSNYIRWLEESRMDFMQQLNYGYEKAVECGIDFAVLFVNCEYKSMVKYNDTVLIYPQITKVTTSRITIKYKIIDEATGVLRATAETGLCYFDNNLQRPIALKKRLPELYELFCNMCVKENE